MESSTPTEPPRVWRVEIPWQERIAYALLDNGYVHLIQLPEPKPEKWVCERWVWHRLKDDVRAKRRGLDAEIPEPEEIAWVWI